MPTTLTWLNLQTWATTRERTTKRVKGGGGNRERSDGVETGLVLGSWRADARVHIPQRRVAEVARRALLTSPYRPISLLNLNHSASLPYPGLSHAVPFIAAVRRAAARQTIYLAPESPALHPTSAHTAAKFKQCAD